MAGNVVLKVELVRRYAAMMCQVVGITTNGMSYVDFDPENDIFGEEFISIAWAWMINAWHQLETDANNTNGIMNTTDHHSSLVKECFELMRMLLHCKDQGWDTMLLVTPNPKVITTDHLTKKQCQAAESVASAGTSGIDALCW